MHHRHLAPAILAASVVALAGCAIEQAAAAPAREAIVNGTEAPDDVSVGFVASVYPGLEGWVICSGTLISRRVVLTAAHCLRNERAPGVEPELHVFFGPLAPTTLVNFEDVVARVTHPDWNPRDMTAGNDLALLLLEDDPGVPPMPLRRAPLDVSMIGMDVRVLGFGRTEAGGTGCPGCGTRRHVTLPVVQFDPEQFALRAPDRGVCNGDSGGPTLIRRDGREEVGGVNSWMPISIDCTSGAVLTRVDVHVADFIEPWIFANDTVTCEGGDYCAPDCERIDPDCDPRCGGDGACLPGCETPDPDCPLVETGARCERGEDCASGDCAPAPDAPSVSYCIAACDPAIATSCPEGMECAGMSGDQRVCVWPLPSPGALGGACVTGEDCADGICVERGETRICSRACDATASPCPDEFECVLAQAGEPVCAPIPPPQGGGCAVGVRSSAPSGLLALAALLMALRRRRSRSSADRAADATFPTGDRDTAFGGLFLMPDAVVDAFYDALAGTYPDPAASVTVQVLTGSSFVGGAVITVPGGLGPCYFSDIYSCDPALTYTTSAGFGGATTVNVAIPSSGTVDVTVEVTGMTCAGPGAWATSTPNVVRVPLLVEHETAMLVRCL